MFGKLYYRLTLLSNLCYVLSTLVILLTFYCSSDKIIMRVWWRMPGRSFYLRHPHLATGITRKQGRILSIGLNSQIRIIFILYPEWQVHNF